MAMPAPRFVFMVLKEHPYGREMLFQLLEAGLAPKLILEEDSKVGDTEREKFLARIEGHSVRPEISEQASERAIPIVTVKIHRDTHCMGPIREVNPDLIVLGGTRIIRGEILGFSRASFGFIDSYDYPVVFPTCREVSIVENLWQFGSKRI